MTEKFYITSENNIIFKCPACGKTKPVSLSKFGEKDHQIKGNVKCPCGDSFSFVVERRKNYRKETRIPGRYRVIAPVPQSAYDDMIVMDISENGLKIFPVASGKIKVDDTVNVLFTLNDKGLAHQINIKVKVVNIFKGDAGAQIIDVVPNDLKEIKFFLF